MYLKCYKMCHLICTRTLNIDPEGHGHSFSPVVEKVCIGLHIKVNKRQPTIKVLVQLHNNLYSWP